MMLAETGSRRAIAGADGRFRLGGLRPGAWELAATSLGRHARAQTIIGLGVAEQVTDVEILIGAGPVIRGRVIDEAGAPAPETTVQAVTRGDSETTTADASGGFTIEGLRPAQYALIGSGGSGYLPNGTTGVALADKDVEGIVVTVRRGLSITGHVEPRQPCDVQVDLSGEAGRGGMILFPSASSGADGNFTIGPAPVGSVVLTARCASGDQGSAHVAISAGMPDTVVAVTPGASIAGRVLDGDGKPVAGIAVTASETSSGERTVITNGMVTSGMRAMTDPAGAYQITGLAAGSYRIGALDRGRPLRLRARLPQLELAAGEHKTGVDLAVDRSDGIIRGTVTGPDSNPLADAWVSAQQDIMATLAADLPSTAPGATVSRTMMVQTSDDGSGSGDAAIAPALTDAQGHYEIVGLPHAVYIVAAEAQRGQLRAHAAGVKPDATVDLRALGVTSLAGKVTGPSGPVAMFSVELDGPTASQRSFTDGSYSFARVDPGTYTVRVEASEGNGQGTVSVTPDQPATLDIALTANAVVIGKLVDPAGAPLAGQPVALAADHGDGRLMVSIEGAAPTSGPDGSFRLEHAAGRYAFMVMRPPSPFSKRGLVLEAGKTLDLGTITVAPPAPPPPAGSATP
jgi:protocatechuate 3,4-dioxygenase beta subunit